METPEEVRRRRRLVVGVVLILLLATLGLTAYRLRPNTPPAITAVIAPATALATLDVPLAVSVHEPDGNPLRVTWSFGNGKGAEGELVTTSWDQPGRYLIRVTVEDGRGGVDASDPVPIAVREVPLADPRDPFNVTYAAYANFTTATGGDAFPVEAEVAFDARASGRWVWTPELDMHGAKTGNGTWDFEARPDLVERWLWSWGDGESSDFNTSAGALPTHAYLAGGLYFVKLTAELTEAGKRTTASWGMTLRVVA